MQHDRFIATLLAASLLVAPAAALAAKDDSKLSAAEYEAKQIAEGKAEGGKMLAPAPAPETGSETATPGPPPGAPIPPPGVPVPPPAAPVELDGTGLIVAIMVLAVGAAAYTDIRRQTV